MAKVTRQKAKGGNCLRRASHNEARGKYERQFARTAANKARRIERQARKFPPR